MHIYGILLNDYAMPSFCSGKKYYYGSIEDIQDFAEACNKNVEYYELEPAQLLEIKIVSVADYFHQHENIWGFPYYVHADQASMELLLIKHGNSFIICCRPTFAAPYLVCEQEDDHQIKLNLTTDHVWGHPGLYKSGEADKILTARLFAVEKIFDDMDQAVADFQTMDCDSCDMFFDDIFGDG